MSIIKKAIAFLLLFACILCATSCEGRYEYPSGGGQGGGGNRPGGGEYVPPEMNDDPRDDFTVTVMADGKPYSPRMEIFVYWSDGFSVHTAKLDKDGVARIDGLDGDYRVTLSAVPNEYTYDPNSNIATNDDRNIVIDLYTLNILSGGGTGIYDCYNFSKTGVYSAVIENADDAIYFQYAPDRSGTYTIESWIDTTADNVNPYIDVYGGSSQFKYYIKTTDDGGAVGSYTINFVHTVSIADENISSAGQVVYTFAVKAESKNNKYPITVTFAVKRNGNFELPSVGGGGGSSNNLAIPTYDFSKYDVSSHEYGDEYKKVYPEYLYDAAAKLYVFDEKRFKLSPDDGFYHVYDEEKYADNGGFGPILYAHVTSVSRFIDRAFSNIEYNASGETINAALSAGGKNYKHFIEGYTQLSTMGNINGGTYYCVSECPCHDASSSEGWACTPECTGCHESCRRCPEELIGHEGYQAYANSDGLVAVTEELKEFLYAYCNKEIFFYDGLGTWENKLIKGDGTEYYIQSKGGSGWLFACVYYDLK